MKTQFFLGANAPSGFASYYDEWVRPEDTKRYFIIKGTPGNGKSSFMRRIAAAMEQRGYASEEILCSGDAGSLDGIRFPELGYAFVDGTNPHAIEPRYPLAWESYVPLVQFVDDGAVRRRGGEVRRLQDALKEDYAGLYRILGALRGLQDEQSALVLEGESLRKLKGRCRGIIRREIRKGGGARLHKRFIDALTPEGAITLWDTVHHMADNVYELQDAYRQAHFMLTILQNAALEAGQEVYACYDPMYPYSVLRHLILPGLRLAFVSSDPKKPYPYESARRIRVNAYIPGELVKQNKLRLRFLRKTEQNLAQDAAELMGRAKHNHDLLEDIYVPAVDFRSLEAFAAAYADSLLAEHKG